MTQAIKIARRVIQTEINGLEQLAASLSQEFERAVDTLNTIKGRLILTGVGKSGHVARKIAATLASTGTPAFYIHPTEASHGDMGMITQDDAVIALSRSGETRELSDVLAFSQRFNIPLIAITADASSTLAKAAHHRLILPAAPEACGETKAPTTSTTLQMALGDALAITLLETKGFTADDFKRFHPGGKLGASLLTVKDIMHGADALPLLDDKANVETAAKIMSEKGFGCVGICRKERLIGIITDGDLRRHLTGERNIAGQLVTDIMTPEPKTVQPAEPAASALRRMTADNVQIMQLFVTQDNRPVGIVHMHDFLKAGLA